MFARTLAECFSSPRECTETYVRVCAMRAIYIGLGRFKADVRGINHRNHVCGYHSHTRTHTHTHAHTHTHTHIYMYVYICVYRSHDARLLEWVVSKNPKLHTSPPLCNVDSAEIGIAHPALPPTRPSLKHAADDVITFPGLKQRLSEGILRPLQSRSIT